jgi:DNA-binding transcriptional regulator YiaG
VQAADFTAAIAALGWSQLEAARQLDVDARTVRRWVAGERAVPGPAVVALRCIARLRVVEDLINRRAARGCRDAQQQIAER